MRSPTPGSRVYQLRWSTDPLTGTANPVLADHLSKKRR
jgi:hypothetical protein